MANTGKSRSFVLMGLGGAVILTVAVVFALRGDDPPAKPAAGKSSAPSRATSRPRPDRPLAAAVLTPQEKGRRLYSPLSSAEWQQAAATLTPAKAREMLERDRTDGLSPEARAERAWHIISQLCRNGYSKEAWDLVEKDPGVVREKALNGFFRDATLPKAELLALLDGTEKKERAMGLSGYWDRFTPEEFVRLDLNEFPIRSPQERAALRQTLEAMAAQAFDPANPDAGRVVRRELLDLAVVQANNGVLAYSDLGKMLLQDPSKDGFAYWDAVRNAAPEFRKEQDSYKGTDAQIIRAMTAQDPERMMEMTLVEGTYERGKSYIALEKWLSQDFRKAEQWYLGHAGRMDADSAAVAFFRANASRGDYEAALAWYGRLQKDGWKNGIGGEMRAVVRKMEAQAAGN